MNINDALCPRSQLEKYFCVCVCSHFFFFFNFLLQECITELLMCVIVIDTIWQRGDGKSKLPNQLSTTKFAMRVRCHRLN